MKPWTDNDFTKERYQRLVGATLGFLFHVEVRNGQIARTIHYPGVEQVTGYTPEDYQSNPSLWVYMIHAEDRPLVLAQVDQVLRGESPTPVEHRIYCKNGTLRWVSNVSVSRRDSNGSVTGYEGTVLDITERKQAELRLQAFAECLIHFGPDAKANINRVVALCGETLGASCALYNRLDDGLLCSMGQWHTPGDYRPTDSPEGHICYDVIRDAKDDVCVIRNLPETVYAKNDPSVLLYGLQTYAGVAVKCRGHATGALCVVYQQDVRLLDGQLDFLRLAGFAIAAEEERHLAETELAHRAEIDRMIAVAGAEFIASTPDEVESTIERTLGILAAFLRADRAYVFQFSGDGATLTKSHEWCAQGILPRQPTPDPAWWLAQLRTRPVIHIPSIDDRSMESPLEETAFQSQHIRSMLVVPLMGQKTPVGVLGFEAVLQTRTWTSAERDALRLLGAAILATIRHKGAERELQASRRHLAELVKELQRSNEELEQFAYVASHDLQEPLRMVSSYVQLLARRYQGKLDADADDYIHFAEDGATRMRKMINDLLDFSRISKSEAAMEPTDISTVVDQATSNLALAIEESRTVITRDLLPIVPGNEPQLIRLFQNLLENAMKFTSGEAPRIHISASLRPAVPNSPQPPQNPPEQNGSLSPTPSDEWVFSVRDNGMGINPRHFDSLFVSFRRLNSDSRFRGVGLGLATCKKIVERHGGRIWIESQAGIGSTFHFTIPTPQRREPNDAQKSNG